MSYLAKTTSKGHDYYKIMESYRENGKIKHRVIYNIGPLRNLLELLPDYVRNGTQKGPVANQADNASQHLEMNVSVDPVRCRIHGGPMMLYSVGKWLGVEDLMNDIFPSGTANEIQRSLSLMLAAIHRACKPGSKNQFAEWFETTSLPDYLHAKPDIFTSQHFWEQMDEISIQNIRDFETKLYEKVLAQFPEVRENLNCLSSDFTNYFTYISNRNFRCTLAQYGHSKEGRSGQKIFNVAVIISPLLGIPIATMIYPGNDNDKTALKQFLAELKERLKGIVDLENVTFVFDGGGASKEALDLIPGHFITRGSLKTSPELYDIPLASYETLELERDNTVTAYRTTVEQYGAQRTAVISLSDELKAGQEKELDKQLKKFDKQIQELNQKLQNPRATTDKKLASIEKQVSKLLSSSYHFSDFIKINYETQEVPDPDIVQQFNMAQKQSKKKGKDSNKPISLEINGTAIHSPDDIPKIIIVTGVKYQVNEEEKTAMCDRYYGKHLLVTDHDDWGTEQILTVYRDQEFIERFFRDSKDTNHFSVRPIYHWTDQKLRVHVMICYLGLTLCRVAQYILDKTYDCHLTCDKLLDKLEHVQECLVFMRVNGESIKPVKTISELSKSDAKVWSAVSKMMAEYMASPAKSIEI